MLRTILGLLVMLPLAAFAKGEGSEYFYQTEAGKHDITPALSMTSEKTKMKGSSEEKTDLTLLTAEYEYGVMEGLAVGAGIGYVVSGKWDDGTNDGKVSGLTDIELTVKGNMPAGPGSLRYGAMLTLSPGDKESESNGDVNAYSGGHSLDPYVGYEYYMDSCTLGAKASVQIGLADRKVKNSVTTADVSGGEHTTVSLFYEHKFSEDMRLGASFDWTTVSDTESKVGSTKTTTENISPVQALNVYMPVKVGMGTLLPQLTYGFTTDDKKSGTDIDSYGITGISVGYRIEL